jgi:hypothetical protein
MKYAHAHTIHFLAECELLTADLLNTVFIQRHHSQFDKEKAYIAHGSIYVEHPVVLLQVIKNHENRMPYRCMM